MSNLAHKIVEAGFDRDSPDTRGDWEPWRSRPMLFLVESSISNETDAATWGVVASAEVTVETTSSLDPAVRVLGVEFRIEEEDGLFYLVHARWSLLGCGPDLAQARESLVEEARDMVDAYSDLTEAEMSRDAVEMIRFARALAQR